MKYPKHARLIYKNKTYPIDGFCFNTGLVRLRETKNVYNTVNIKNVVFDFSGMTTDDIKFFWKEYRIKAEKE